jgi:hypothetical protein
MLQQQLMGLCLLQCLVLAMVQAHLPLHQVHVAQHQPTNLLQQRLPGQLLLSRPLRKVLNTSTAVVWCQAHLLELLGVQWPLMLVNRPCLIPADQQAQTCACTSL